MAIILKGGTIVTAKKFYKSDIKIDDNKISQISPNIEVENNEFINIEGCFVIPGGIDTHTHLDMDAGKIKTSDDFYSGTKAAILGGTTTILDFAEASEGESLIDAFEKYKQKAKDKSYCDYSFHMTITSLSNQTLDEMEELALKGITSFKLYMAYKGILQVDDAMIYKILKKAKELGCIVAFHCENGDILDVLIEEEKNLNHLSPKYHPTTRPNLLEKEAISRLVDLTDITKSRSYVVHLSTKEGLEEIKKAQEKNINIKVETCPQYLLLDDSLYNSEGFEGAKYVMSPPLRKKEDILSLWEGLKKGYIQTIGTDHCSFNYKGQKDLGIRDFTKIPNGCPGIEHRIALLYTYGVVENKININKFVELTSTNAAKIFGMYPKKGEIAVGSDADLVVINPNKKDIISAKNHNQNVDYTPYEGFEVACTIEHVLLRGKCIVKESSLMADKTVGTYIRRKTL